jgi:polyphosphate kinase
MQRHMEFIPKNRNTLIQKKGLNFTGTGGKRMELGSEQKISKYINRDLSWLEFNKRVLQEGLDDSVPLLEKIKFLSIVSTNLDEFISIRAAGIMGKIRRGNNESDFTGLTPRELLHRVKDSVQQMVADQYTEHNRISRFLSEEGIEFTTYQDLDSEQKNEMQAYFYKKVFPVLTPLAVDKSRPFPLIRAKSIYTAVVLSRLEDQSSKKRFMALVEVPAILSRFVEISPESEGKKRSFILLEDLIKEHIPTLFNQYLPLSCNMFRLTRNADLNLDEEGTEDLLDEMEKVLRSRKWGAPVRLELETGFDEYALQLLKEELEIDGLIYSVNGPLDLSYYMAFSGALKGYDHLKYPDFTPAYPREFTDADDFFKVLQSRDVLVFHPYESFKVVDDFIEKSAEDPLVLAIKMTLYRVSGDSGIVHSLIRAAEAGKQVTVVLELKARFDEERNIVWAKALEKAGCHVVYGLTGLKIHAKMTLVVRKEADSLRSYVHVATGNYNGATAQIFTDIGLFTSNNKIGEDVTFLYNEITGFSTPQRFHSLAVSPTQLKDRLFSLIQQECENAALGKPAAIIAKMNSLSNKELIDRLYAASNAGVQIDLIVRGICSLRPGIPGLSEHITVRSIVDRFLEHSRVFYFESAGSPQVWISSADWMTRNLDRRIELMCPVLDEGLKSVIIRYLMLVLGDNVKASEMLPNGQYIRIRNEKSPCRSQFEAMDIITAKYHLSEEASSHNFL